MSVDSNYFEDAFFKLKEMTPPCSNCNVEWASCTCTMEDLQKLELEYLISRDISKTGIKMIADRFNVSDLSDYLSTSGLDSMNQEDLNDYFKLTNGLLTSTNRAYDARICAFNLLKYESDAKDIAIEKRDYAIEVHEETIADLKIEISLNNRDNLDMAAGFRELQAENAEFKAENSELKAEIAELQKFKDSVLRDVYARSARGSAGDIWESPRFTADSIASIESIESATSANPPDFAFAAPERPSKKARSS